MDYSKNTTHSETFGNGLEVFVMDSGPHRPAAIANLAHGDTLVIDGDHGTWGVFTLFGSSAAAGELCINDNTNHGMPADLYAGKNFISDTLAISRNASMLCAGQHPDHGKKALQVSIGDVVAIEGAYYTFNYMAHNTDHMKLVKVEVDTLSALRKRTN